MKEKKKKKREKIEIETTKAGLKGKRDTLQDCLRREGGSNN